MIESLEEVINTLLIFLVALIIRVLVVRNATAGYDSYGHLYFVKEVKRQNSGPFGVITTKVVGSKNWNAPFLWHWLVGFLPFDKMIRFQKWINAGIDILFSIFIYRSALWIDLSVSASFFMVLLYLLTPMWFSRLAIGPRLAGFTPRLSSELAVNLFFIVMLLPLGFSSSMMLICGALISAFVILISKFGLQVMVFLVPLTSLVVWNPMPIGGLSLGFAVAVGVTKGRFLVVVGEQFHHLKWYFNKNLKEGMLISKRNSFAKLFAKERENGGGLRYIANVLFRCIVVNSYTATLLKMPVLLVAVVLYGMILLSGGDEPPVYIVGPVIAASLVFLIINLPPFLFLGEAERYLNHVAFFIVAMTVLLVAEMGVSWIILMLLGYGLLYWIAESFFLHRYEAVYRGTSRDIDDAIISHLKSARNDLVVLPYPYSAVGGWRIILETDHRVIDSVTVTQEFSAMFEQTYAADYPYVKLEKLDDMSNHLGVNFLIVRKKDLVTRGLETWEPSSQWRKISVGEPVYSVFQRD